MTDVEIAARAYVTACNDEGAAAGMEAERAMRLIDLTDPEVEREFRQACTRRGMRFFDREDEGTQAGREAV